MHDAGRRTLEHLQNARELRKPEHRAGHQNKSLELLRSCFKDCSSRRGQKHARFFTCVPGKPKTSEWQMVYLKWWIKCIVVLCGSNLCRDSCTFWTCTWSVTSSSAAWLKSMCRGRSRFSRKSRGDEVVVVENTEGEDFSCNLIFACGDLLSFVEWSLNTQTFSFRTCISSTLERWMCRRSFPKHAAKRVEDQLLGNCFRWRESRWALWKVGQHLRFRWELLGFLNSGIPRALGVVLDRGGPFEGSRGTARFRMFRRFRVYSSCRWRSGGNRDGPVWSWRFQRFARMGHFPLKALGSRRFQNHGIPGKWVRSGKAGWVESKLLGIECREPALGEGVCSRFCESRYELAVGGTGWAYLFSQWQLSIAHVSFLGQLATQEFLWWNGSAWIGSNLTSPYPMSTSKSIQAHRAVDLLG